MNPAQAIAAALIAAGLKTQTAQAAAVGVPRDHWHLWIKAKKRMREDSIRRCLLMALENGFDIQLEWNATGCTATATKIGGQS